MQILYLLILLWIAWLVIDGLLSGAVWVKGGSEDRFTRNLDMRSFATKLHRTKYPVYYWLAIVFYSAAAVYFFYLSINT